MTPAAHSRLGECLPASACARRVAHHAHSGVEVRVVRGARLARPEALHGQQRLLILR
eukprot:CAMPEP_0202857696 /NCGR_PEP_ID=MMETSP1391-20130828/537_1 /ASSEMBLY_ACC=CAM_ASM_000867 /TAXON_ID=1034604 /ORGANISM="Chlamydomonas leiostraca, Strain SAG 11-49" /LENGTH=56 /DNA_ID=CAMNT_0049536533 /DNA_START=247 /DNA_END=413 /DNA_ORIENTATION=+